MLEYAGCILQGRRQFRYRDIDVLVNNVREAGSAPIKLAFASGAALALPVHLFERPQHASAAGESFNRNVRPARALPFFGQILKPRPKCLWQNC